MTENAGHTNFDVAVIGGGIAGLAVATALVRKGHTVTVYESNAELSEFGAGLNLSANATRLLYAWDVDKQFKKVVLEPDVLSFKRWKDGSELGQIPLNPSSEWIYGFPHWQVFRPDLQSILYQAAIRDGAKVMFGRAVQDVNTEDGKLTFRDGSSIQADIVVGADGIWSKSRSFLPSAADVKPVAFREHLYRVTIDREQMETDPVTDRLMNEIRSIAWCGPNSMAMGYAMASGLKYNMVIPFPRSHPDAEVSSWNHQGDPDELRRLTNDWCEEMVHLMKKVDSCAVWTLGEVEKIKSYVSDSGRFALVGDAAHAVLPHAGQGACMALEDAAALAEFVSSATGAAQLPDVMRQWSVFRQDRVERVRRIASGNADMFSLPDGPAQTARDAQLAAVTSKWRSMESELGRDGMKTKLIQDRPSLDPNAGNMASPEGRMYLYGYDVLSAAKTFLAKP